MMVNYWFIEIQRTAQNPWKHESRVSREVAVKQWQVLDDTFVTQRRIVYQLQSTFSQEVAGKVVNTS